MIGSVNNCECQEGHAEVVRLLLAHPGTDVNLATSDAGFTPLMAASLHPDVVQLLLAHPDIDVNQEGPKFNEKI